MRKTMHGVLRYAAGRDLVLEDMDPSEGVGCSLLEKMRAIVRIAFGFLFPKEMSDAEKEIVLYGVGVHEVLHILRTDFAYAAKMMESFPVFERKARHIFANILEDAAIEYLRSDRLSEFMHKALTASIGFFHRTGPSLGEQDSAWAELITALIQFGDVGVLKGTFKFPEAEQAFMKCLHPYQQGITEPDFSKRFELSQEMFEICRPLWEAYMKNALAESALKNLLQALGKNLFSGSGPKGQSPQENGRPASSGSPSEANERRKKTIHLVDEAQAEEMRRQAEEEGGEASDPSEATDIYVTVGGSDDENGSEGAQAGAGGSSGLSPEDLGLDENDDVEVVDERKNRTPENAGEESGSDSGASQSESADGGEEGNGSSDEKEGASAAGGSSESGESGSESSGGSAGETSGESLTKEDVLRNVSLSDDGTGSSSTPAGGEDEPSESEGESSSVGAVGSSGEAGADAAGESSEKKDLGEELRELSRKLSEELNASGELEIPEDFSREMEESMESELERERREEAILEKKGKAEAIDVAVESPYYTDVKYVNVECFVPDAGMYAAIRTPEIKRYELNLRSSFKKIFAFKNGRKEYRTNGRIDVDRFSGKKLTARMFYRNSKPADKSDMAMVIFVDQSGSMRGSMDRVKQTLAVLLGALRGFDVKVKVVGFTTNNEVTYFHYGNRKWENDERLAMCCMRMNASGGTFLGHALRYTGAMLKNRPERNKLYVCITDGDPSYYVYENYSQGMNDCRQAVNEVRKYADVIGIGLYHDEESENVFKYVFRDSCASMSSLDGLVRELPRRVKKILAE